MTQELTSAVRYNSSGKETRTYRSWADMKRRCYSSRRKDYKYYGARGIRVETSWHCYEAFYRDMGECPEGFSLDRIDADKDYSKENCRWILKRENVIRKKSSPVGVTGIRGVHYRKDAVGFAARVNTPFGRKQLGIFPTAIQAESAIKVYKEQHSGK